MSRLDDLIGELCPEGVDYRRLSEVATISRGGNFQKKDYVEKGTPCIHYGQIYTRYNLFVHNTASFISDDVAARQKYAVTGDIIMAVTSENIEDVCKCVAWLGKGKVAVSGHAAIIHHTLDPKYLVYYFHSNKFFEQKRKMAHGTKVIEVTPDKLADIMLPVPPLEVQREIVRILDNFTGLAAELTTELTAELAARKKQYEYYRDMLLSFDNNAKETMCDISWLPISAIAETNIGLATTVTKHKAQRGVLLIHNSDIQQNAIVLKQHEYITEDFAERNKKKRLQLHDIITVHTGDVGTSAVINEHYSGAIGFTTITTRIRDKKRIIPEYLCHYLNSQRCKKEIAALTISDRSNLNQKNFERIVVPIPSVQRQKEIICILDRFEALCSNLISSLPAEIDARQKQYEYYRDKLLTFKQHA